MRVLIAGVLALGMTSPTRASSIQTRWDNFLAGGVTEWASTPPPPITLQIKIEIAQALESTSPSTNLFDQYLHWRRNLDPTRFDHYHPIEGPIIAGFTFPSTSTPDPVINPQPQKINTPEPGSMTLALGLIGAGVWWRRRSQRGLTA
ncbi:MAG: PEP-CTERM sorting domain-containing protein [Isosphaeraceae bacterium]|nr:PEP-CTERM sorting domain-containing protein [Isosphaeraceae bacterium]